MARLYIYWHVSTFIGTSLHLLARLYIYWHVSTFIGTSLHWESYYYLKILLRNS